MRKLASHEVDVSTGTGNRHAGAHHAWCRYTTVMFHNSNHLQNLSQVLKETTGILSDINEKIGRQPPEVLVWLIAASVTDRKVIPSLHVAAGDQTTKSENHLK